LRVKGQQEKVKSENVVNLYVLNTILGMFGGKNSSVNYKDIYGELQMKDYNFLTRKDFETREEFIKYLKEEVKPIREMLGEEE